MLRDSKSLEISCYIVGAGAFGIFFRWMQLQLAYNESGLPDSSVWNVLLPALVLIMILVFRKFVAKFRSDGCYLPEDFFTALANNGKLFGFFRWMIGIVMIAGSALLLVTCETDKNAMFLRILGILGLLSGISFPILLTTANKPHVGNRSTLSLLSLMPILMFAFWLVTCYKENSINPIGWDYAVELAAIIFALVAFFRVAGFVYGVPDEYKSMLFCMLGGMMCITTAADSRNMGEQIMFVAAAMMLIMYNWIMVANLVKKEKRSVYADVYEDEGFERIK